VVAAKAGPPPSLDRSRPPHTRVATVGLETDDGVLADGVAVQDAADDRQVVGVEVAAAGGRRRPGASAPAAPGRRTEGAGGPERVHRVRVPGARDVEPAALCV